MFTHQYDKRSAANIGSRAERIFISLAVSKGFEVSPSKVSENKINHIDFFLKKENVVKSVDVKARKKLSAYDSSYNDDWTWVEFQNANGFKGWLYGDADYIAFEKECVFLMVDRISLLHLSESLVDRSKDFAKRSSDAKYRIYQRRDEEEISLIKTSDIKKLKRCTIWKKDGF
jgi:hypothetical protein